MRYLPKSPAERKEMLAAIGAKSIDQLFLAFRNVSGCAKH